VILGAGQVKMLKSEKQFTSFTVPYFMKDG